MSKIETINLISEQDTKNLAQRLAKYYLKLKSGDISSSFKIYLNGDLGAGKTTFTRFFIQCFGQQDIVKSPTYTLIENYEFGDSKIYHLDLYRLSDPEELNFLGLEDVISDPDAIILIEWPEKGMEFLPKPNLELNFVNNDDNRSVVFDLSSLNMELWKQCD